ncbi:LysM domain protein [Aspergillus nomiae NRRL 13137]|uniref:LysM domain protein n=1 Tax=Aspergillus nomiae NRRL (strain ATCC 15546 / NRRL 13137 / CBS 260.88 / M93) TaxID=1509407 RepID=A0A0L1J797_ASPN3|nr:LysM domain protein [Aspergillus nomiae NRRL 13137]KNG87540.1 LysM domain protein [Aspergillus nomiae NRRL 13137]
MSSVGDKSCRYMMFRLYICYLNWVVDNCNEFYLVVADDSCFDISAAHGRSLAGFYAWNPAVGTSCGGLWPDYYVCVGILSDATTTTTISTTATTTGNGVSTPTPTQAGMVSGCDSFYLVISGDECWDIATQAGITLDEFYTWNPDVGTLCTGLWPDYYVCVGVL